MVSVFLQSLLIGYSGAMMPGSLLTYTIEKSMKSGAKSGPLIIAGHSLLELVIVMLIFAGAGKFLAEETTQTVIGIIGGLVLNYMGIIMIRDAAGNKLRINISTASGNGKGGMIAGGAIISASNPYFLLWWAVIGLGLILSAFKAFGIWGIIFFYFGHVLADFSWYSFISLVISKTKSFISLKIYRVVILVLGMCLCGFGVSFIVNSLKYLHLV